MDPFPVSQTIISNFFNMGLFQQLIFLNLGLFSWTWFGSGSKSRIIKSRKVKEKKKWLISLEREFLDEFSNIEVERNFQDFNPFGILIFRDFVIWDFNRIPPDFCKSVCPAVQTIDFFAARFHSQRITFNLWTVALAEFVKWCLVGSHLERCFQRLTICTNPSAQMSAPSAFQPPSTRTADLFRFSLQIPTICLRVIERNNLLFDYFVIRKSKQSTTERKRSKK